MPAAGVPVEWIGLRSPMESDVVMFRILTGIYSETEDYWLKVMAAAVARFIRVDGKRARVVGPQDAGLSQHYRFGHWRGSYTQRMTEQDARRLMDHPLLGLEFRNMVTEPAREPVIPQVMMNRIIWEALNVADNGPGVYLTGDTPAVVNRPVSPILGLNSGQLNLPPREVQGFRY